MNAKTAPLVAVCLLKNWDFPYLVPRSILTNNSKQFIKQFFRHVCAILGVKLIPITAYHPQSNGETERYNKSVATCL